jgi:hypothetical protein
VLAGGDWIPGSITVVAALAGLARQVPVIRDLCATLAATGSAGRRECPLCD